MRLHRWLAASVVLCAVGGPAWLSCASAPPSDIPAAPPESAASKMDGVAGAPVPSAPSVPPVSSKATPAPSETTSSGEESGPGVSFEKSVLPILEARCRPCHFPGGKMYARLPFDCPRTARLLGTKLFTRIRSESDQAAIRIFLSSSPTPDEDLQEHCRFVKAP